MSPPLLPHAVIQRSRGKKALELGRKLSEPGFEAATQMPLTPRPPVLFVRDGTARVVVRRESFEDLLRCDVG